MASCGERAEKRSARARISRKIATASTASVAATSQWFTWMYSMRRSMQRAAEDRTGHKKGAHYSAHMRRLRIPGLIAPLLLLALAAAPVGAAARHAAPERSHTDARQARAQLEALRGQIARISRQVSRGQAARDRLTRQLRDTEKS